MAVDSEGVEYQSFVHHHPWHQEHIDKYHSGPSHICPECAAGKHLNCAGFAYDEHDREVACNCLCQQKPETD